jgi:chromosome segregation ATPase
MNSVGTLGLLVMIALLGLNGCSKTDVEVSNLNKTAHDLKQEMGDLKKSQGQLSASINQLSDSQKTIQAEYADLKKTSDYLKTSLEQKDTDYENLIVSLEKLRNSQTKLDNSVTQLTSELSKKMESYATRSGSSERPGVRDFEATSAYAETRGRRVTERISADACEAIERYMKQLNNASRSRYGTAQDTQMQRALTELKLAINQFADQKDTTKILGLAEEARWYAYNASRSRTYIAGEPGWENLLKENKRKLISVCIR